MSFASHCKMVGKDEATAVLARAQSAQGEIPSTSLGAGSSLRLKNGFAPDDASVCGLLISRPASKLQVFQFNSFLR
ncbi:MAG: hypothetical protein ACLQLC_13595 [Candidatus Sulfotelmatobacter sp.]